MIRISFVIPIYNMEEYLERCLESIRCQSIFEYEVLMVDDGSTDKTGEICGKFTGDPRFKYIKTENSGVSAARNIGLENAHGEWISFIDPDDFLEDSFSAEMLHLADEVFFKGADIICCCCNLIKNDTHTKLSFFSSDVIFGCRINKEGYAFRDKTDLLAELFDKNYESKVNRTTAVGVPWGKLYKREMLTRNSLTFDKQLIRMQDNVFNMYAFEAANSIVYCDKPLYNYNTDNISSFSGKYDPRTIKYLPQIMEKRREYLSEKKLLDNEMLMNVYKSDSVSFINIMLRKYFLNPHHACGMAKRIAEIKEFFSTEQYREVFLYEDITYRSMEAKTRFELLKNKHYFALIVFERLFRIYRKDKL